MDLLERSLANLEWNTFLRHYSENCRSVPAKEQALALIIPEEIGESEMLLEATSEALSTLSEFDFACLEILDSMAPALERLAIGSTLSSHELLQMQRLLRVAEAINDFFRRRKDPSPIPLLQATWQKLFLSPEILRQLNKILDRDGSIKDSASPRLAKLRQEERSLQLSAREKAQEVLQSAVKNGYAQDSFLDQRDNRYLIPIKSEHRTKVSGLVIEASSSRASVYVEPAAVREIQEKISQARQDIEEEIYRILEEVSLQLNPFANELKSSYSAAIEIDLTIARARSAAHFESIRGVARPEFKKDFCLEGLYHPLLALALEPQKIIRNTLRITAEQKIMIISGPNTGGKTVLLKAAGLASLMARAGFYICASGEASLPHSRYVLAQIGDEQSLEKSLSSFSASIASLKEILAKAGPRSFVLIDEILHSTDPEEAAALAKAILEHFSSCASFAIVTTHLHGLRVHGDDRYQSASMEFDAEHMVPTYRLRLGVPGSSRALETAERLGLPARIIQNARAYIDSKQVSLAEILSSLEQKELLLEQERSDFARQAAALAQDQAAMQLLKEQLQEQKRNFQAQARARLRELEREALSQAESLLEEYKSRVNSLPEKHEAAIAAKEKFQSLKAAFKPSDFSLVEEESTASVKDEIDSYTAKESSPWQVGARVWVSTLQAEGELLTERTELTKKAEVAIGTMKLKVEWDKLSLRKSVAPAPSSFSRKAYQAPAECAPELQLLGNRVEEALVKLADYLDRASRSGRPSVRIVHGFGTGALRESVRDYLKKSGYAIHFRSGTSSEGGDGCTVVEFK